jgi:hypothetical protein
MNVLDSERVVEDLLEILRCITNSYTEIAPKADQGRLYLVIGSKNTGVGVTSDLKVASSARKVAEFTLKLLNQVILNPNDKVRSRQLSRIYSFLPFISYYPHSSSRAARAEICKIEKQAKSQPIIKLGVTFNNIEENSKDYGKYRHVSKTKMTEEGDPLVTERSSTFEAYKRRQIERQEIEARERGDQQISHFDKLIEVSRLTTEQVKQAFRIDLEREVSAPMALQHLIGSFDRVLDHHLDKIEKGESTANEVYTKFHSLLKESIVDTNTETIRLDRALFRDIMGNRVKDGMKAKGPPSSFPFDTEEVKMLIEEYHKGSWQETKNEEGEVINPKTLTYQNIQTQVDQDGKCEMDHIEAGLDKVLKHPSFEKILQRVFDEVGRLGSTIEPEFSFLEEEGEHSPLDTKQLMTIIPDF